MKCIGVFISSGEYQGYPFHNAILHCLGDRQGDGVKNHGQSVETHKVKMKLLDDYHITPRDLIDQDIRVIYNQYKNVVEVEVL